MQSQFIGTRELINERFIIQAKRTISVQYASATTAKRAAVLADAIHRAVDSKLPHVPASIKVNMRFQLLEHGYRRNRFRITIDDVFNCCLKHLDFQEDHLFAPFCNWLKEQLQIEAIVDEAWLSSALKQLQLQKIADESVTLEQFFKTFSSFSSWSGQWNEADAQPNSTELACDVGIVEAAATSEVISEASPPLSLASLPMFKPMLAAFLFLGFTVISVMLFSFSKPEDDLEATNIQVEIPEADETVVISETYQGAPNALPPAYQYTTIDPSALKAWLEGRNSLLVDSPYFEAILEAAYTHNIHPLLLFAITGQEQGFVPRDHSQAEQIANNPFNVYHSWQEYNTTIEDSVRIAAITLLNLSEERPDEVHPLQWINRKYAEDSNWWVGVDRLFQQLQSAVME